MHTAKLDIRIECINQAQRIFTPGDVTAQKVVEAAKVFEEYLTSTQ